MQIERITGIFFSPTGTTEQVVKAVIAGASEGLLSGEKAGSAVGASAPNGSIPVTYIDLTMPAARQREYRFGEGDLVVVGCPTYAGRLPNKVMPDLRKHLQGRTEGVAGPYCIPVVTFGNRSCDESLKELALLMKENGFTVVAGTAAVCRHAFTDRLADGRPDEADRAALEEFGGRVARRIAGVAPRMGRPDGYLDGHSDGLPDGLDILADRELSVGPYYTPLKEDGSPADFLKAKSNADPGKCSRCMLCAGVCPMGSIDQSDPFNVPGICIKCQACVRKCPMRARFFDDPDFLSHVRMLERSFTERKEIIFWEYNNLPHKR